MCTYYTELYTKKLKHLHNNYTGKVHNIRTEEISELYKLKIYLEKTCEEIKVIAANEETEFENILTRTKSQNAINICNIISLVKH